MVPSRPQRRLPRPGKAPGLRPPPDKERCSNCCRVPAPRLRLHLRPGRGSCGGTHHAQRYARQTVAARVDHHALAHSKRRLQLAQHLPCRPWPHLLQASERLRVLCPAAPRRCQRIRRGHRLSQRAAHGWVRAEHGQREHHLRVAPVLHRPQSPPFHLQRRRGPSQRRRELCEARDPEVGGMHARGVAPLYPERVLGQARGWQRPVHHPHQPAHLPRERRQAAAIRLSHVGSELRARRLIEERQGGLGEPPP